MLVNFGNAGRNGGNLTVKIIQGIGTLGRYKRNGQLPKRQLEL
jgi:hypothetical protein